MATLVKAAILAGLLALVAARLVHAAPNVETGPMGVFTATVERGPLGVYAVATVLQGADSPTVQVARSAPANRSCPCTDECSCGCVQGGECLCCKPGMATGAARTQRAEYEADARKIESLMQASQAAGMQVTRQQYQYPYAVNPATYRPAVPTAYSAPVYHQPTYAAPAAFSQPSFSGMVGSAVARCGPGG